MRNYQIRKAAAGDLSAIREILEQQNLTSDDVGEHLQDFLVAEVDGIVGGTIGMEFYDTIALLRSAAVLPAYQREGIGDKLVASIDAYAREHGMQEILLLTTTAEEYFSRKGFNIIDRNEITGKVLTSSQFSGACPASAVSMRKKL